MSGDHEAALERAIEAYATARQLALDFNQPEPIRAEHAAEAMRAAGDILELLD